MMQRINEYVPSTNAYSERIFNSILRYDFVFLNSFAVPSLLKEFKKEHIKSIPSINAVIDKFLYVVKINELDLKYRRINFILDEMYSSYLEMDNNPVLADILSSVMVYCQFTFEEIINAVKPDSLFYISNAIVLQKRNNANAALSNLEKYFSKEPISDKNLSVWEYYVFQSLKKKTFKPLFKQIEYYDKLSQEMKTNLSEAVKFINNELKIIPLNDKYLSKFDLDCIAEEMRRKFTNKKYYNEVDGFISFFNPDFFNSKMTLFLDNLKYAQAEWFLEAYKKKYSHHILDEWEKKIKRIKINLIKYRNLLDDKTYFSKALHAEKIQEDKLRAEKYYKLSIENKEYKCAYSVRFYASLVAKRNIEEAITIIHKYKSLILSEIKKDSVKNQRSKIAMALFIVELVEKSNLRLKIFSTVNEAIKLIEESDLKELYKKRLGELYLKKALFHLQSRHIKKDCAISCFEMALSLGANEQICHQGINKCKSPNRRVR